MINIGNTIPKEFSSNDLDKEIFQEVIKNIKDSVDYFWFAKFKDGTTLSQYNKDGSENLAKRIFDEEKKENLDQVWWIPLKNKTSYGLKLEENQRLILVRRNYIRTTADGQERSTIYMLGWQKTENEKNIKNILFLNKDGKFEVSDNFEHYFV